MSDFLRRISGNEGDQTPNQELPSVQFGRTEAPTAQRVDTFVGRNGDLGLQPLLASLRGFSKSASDAIYDTALHNAEEDAGELRNKAFDLLRSGATPEEVLADPAFAGESDWLMTGAHEAVGRQVADRVTDQMALALDGRDENGELDPDSLIVDSMDEALLAVTLGGIADSVLPADLPAPALSAANEVIRDRMTKMIQLHQDGVIEKKRQYEEAARAGDAGRTGIELHDRLATSSSSAERQLVRDHAVRTWQDQLILAEAGGIRKEDAEAVLVAGVGQSVLAGIREGGIRGGQVGSLFSGLRSAIADYDEETGQVLISPGSLALVNQLEGQALSLITQMEEDGVDPTEMELFSAYYSADTSTPEGLAQRRHVREQFVIKYGPVDGGKKIRDLEGTEAAIVYDKAVESWVDEQINDGSLSSPGAVKAAWMSRGYSEEEYHRLPAELRDRQMSSLEKMMRHRVILTKPSAESVVREIDKMQSAFARSLSLSADDSAQWLKLGSMISGRMDEEALAGLSTNNQTDRQRLIEATGVFARARNGFRTRLLSLAKEHPEWVTDPDLQERLAQQAWSEANTNLVRLMETTSGKAAKDLTGSDKALTDTATSNLAVSAVRSDPTRASIDRLSTAEAALELRAHGDKYSPTARATLRLRARGYDTNNIPSDPFGPMWMPGATITPGDMIPQ